jgi:large subunit ribosomal protein L25
MELQELNVKKRTETGKNTARRTRRDGEVPGVLYGDGKEAVGLSVNSRKFVQLIHGKSGEHAVVQLNVDGEPGLNTPALLKSVQHHPVRGHVVHFDFQRIRLDVKIQTVVSIDLVGRPKGVIDGGVMDHQLREVEVECLATNVPDVLTFDVSGLDIGENAHVSEIVPPEGVTILTDGDRTIATVLASRLARTDAEEAAEGEETEVVEDEPAAS